MKIHARICLFALLSIAFSCDAFLLKGHGSAGASSSADSSNNIGGGSANSGGHDFQAIIGYENLSKVTRENV